MNATKTNMDAFAIDWSYRNGGTYENAMSVWRVELMRNLRRDLLTPFPSDDELIKLGLMIKPKSND